MNVQTPQAHTRIDRCSRQLVGVGVQVTGTVLDGHVGNVSLQVGGLAQKTTLGAVVIHQPLESRMEDSEDSELGAVDVRAKWKSPSR